MVGCQEEHPACKNWVMRCWHGYLSGLWSEVQMICIWSSWCHCHHITSCFIKIQTDLTFMVVDCPGCLGNEAVKGLFCYRTARPCSHTLRSFVYWSISGTQFCCRHMKLMLWWCWQPDLTAADIPSPILCDGFIEDLKNEGISYSDDPNDRLFRAHG